MIISLDLDLIENMSRLADTISNNMKQCVSIINKVTEHNDWNCKERDFINENIVSIKKNDLLLCEQTEQFSNIMKKIVNSFRDIELKIPKEYQSVNKTFSSALSISTDESFQYDVGKNSLALADEISASVNVTGKIQNSLLGALCDKISVCRFSDISYK